MRRLVAAAIGATCAFVVVPASRVAAHASFIESNPVDGSVLAASPPVAELHFTEPVLISASSVHLLHLGSGEDVDLALSSGPADTTLLADMPTLERGAYILRFVAVDPADLHKTVGSISFGIGVAAPPSESGAQVDGTWLTIALRVITDAAMILTVGAVVLAVLIVRRGRRNLDHVGRLAAVGSAVVAIGWVGLLVADAAAVGFNNVQWGSLFLSSDPGRRAVVGLQLALGVWWFERLLRRGGSHAAQWFIVRVLAVIAAGFVVVAAYGGHAGVGGSFLVGVVLRALHLASLCAWIGSVAAVWLIGRRDPRVRELWPAVSALAAIGLAATGATGLLLSGRLAVTVTALLGTTYGQWIVLKAGLLLVLAVLGALAARRVRRGDVPTRLALEVGVAGIAVVVAALLASAAPARGAQFLQLPEVESQIVTSDLSDLTVSASIEPARPGPNLVQVRVLDTRRPAPGPVENVTVRVIGGDGSVIAERQGVPADSVIEWSDVSVPRPGIYRVEVDVSRPARPVPAFVASWSVDPTPIPRARQVLSTREWAPIAAILAGIWVIVVAGGRWGTRRSGRPIQPSLHADLMR
ncbi:MAG: copper resistance protein CopC [Ilumatobacteraceae bacterium]